MSGEAPPKASRPERRRAARAAQKAAKAKGPQKVPRPGAAAGCLPGVVVPDALLPLLADVRRGDGQPLTQDDVDLVQLVRYGIPGHKEGEPFNPWDQATRYTTPEGATEEEAQRCYFDPCAAAHVLGFVATHCRLVKGGLAGQAPKVPAWQRAVLACLFGWKRPDGLRRFRECLLYVPRKNAKTTLAAWVALYLTVADKEPGAEVYSAAGAKEQASKIWETLDRIRHLNPAVRARTQSYQGHKSLTYPQLGCVYRAIPSDAKLQHGGDSHGVLIDELHVLENDELVEVLTTSTGSRRQPLTLYTTTADFNRESVCNATLKRAKEVRANGGRRDRPGYDPELLPVVYEAGRDDDWQDPKVWAKANPNLGVSLRRDYMEGKVRQALASPRKRNTFLRLHLNVQTDADVAWVPMDLWDKCTGPHTPLALRLELKGCLAFGALDLSSRKDLSALVLFFPEARALVPYLWMPEARARELARDHGRTEWLTWAEQGYLELCRGRSIRQEAIKRRVLEVVKAYQVETFSFDRWGMHKLRGELEDENLDLAEFGQGFRDMSEPAKHLEQLWLDEQLVHGGHPVLRACAQNVMVSEDPAGNIKPNKQRSTGPIDGIVASVMAVGGWLVSKPKGKPSVYRRRGVIRL